MEIEVYQVTKQDDGAYSANLNFKNDAGKVVKQKTIIASTKAGFKDQIRAFKEKIEQMEIEKLNLLAIVQTAIDEVMAEG